MRRRRWGGGEGEEGGLKDGPFNNFLTINFILDIFKNFVICLSNIVLPIAFGSFSFWPVGRHVDQGSCSAANDVPGIGCPQLCRSSYVFFYEDRMLINVQEIHCTPYIGQPKSTQLGSSNMPLDKGT
jgi:hypothetical protein